MLRWEVTKPESGLKLGDFLKGKLGLSLKLIKRELDQGKCLLNGLTEKFGSTIVGIGDIIEFQESLQIHVAEGSILYEDEQLLIYDKPPYITVESLEGKIKKRLVHRLDKETSGALIFAKDEETFDLMVKQFKQKSVQKNYLALVDGVPKEAEGIIENYLGKIKQWQGQSLWGAVDPERGHYAQTDWICLRKGPQYALVECVPITGRTHQIRTHMASIGHPILGDKQYGQAFRCKYPAPRTMLHAYQLKFQNPKTGLSINVEAPLPKDFVEAMEVLWK